MSQITSPKDVASQVELVSALQIAGTDLIMAAGIAFSETVNGRVPPVDALDRANQAIGKARDVIAAFERARRPIAA